MKSKISDKIYNDINKVVKIDNYIKSFLDIIDN